MNCQQFEESLALLIYGEVSDETRRPATPTRRAAQSAARRLIKPSASTPCWPSVHGVSLRPSSSSSAARLWRTRLTASN